MYREQTIDRPPAFDPIDYLGYLQKRWQVAALACAIAFSLTFIVSKMLPKRYTSTASILIEPPGGTDPRTFTAISPVYLESLRTYEHFATSDTLFLRALEKFRLRETYASSPVESLKRRIVKVSKLRDTKVLQISVTLENPTQAQAMVRFLADETVKLSSSVTRDSGRDLIEEAQRQVDEAKRKLEDARGAWLRYTTEEPVEALQAELEPLLTLQYQLRRSAAEASASASEYESRAKSATDAADRQRLTAQAASDRAGAEQFAKRVTELEQSAAEKNRILARRMAQRETLEARRKAEQSSLDAATSRLQSMQASLGYSGERLKIIDPGIVPELPSEPNTAINCMVALGLAALGSFVYLSMAYNLRR